MKKTFRKQKCDKCVNKIECIKQQLCCDGTRYKEIDYLQTFKDLIKIYVDMIYQDYGCEINYEQQKTIELIEDLLKKEANGR